jgi:hypothetical protein
MDSNLVFNGFFAFEKFKLKNLTISHWEKFEFQILTAFRLEQIEKFLLPTGLSLQKLKGFFPWINWKFSMRTCNNSICWARVHPTDSTVRFARVSTSYNHKEQWTPRRTNLYTNIHPIIEEYPNTQTVF